ncbi:CDP-glycerol glycerophosphotransferase family protein [Microbacterium sp. KSW4-17]|uniref:CDP-glycerol glycerophosphotransferase family protein n=1 Tax=Microbacterium galbum TaxID=3075994 RepID=A0ABU3TAE6_9MICO|nr:CDP-glycerol glycerophosphotransferase family protein [Microbacterium sp. KSW4-17]MDU0368235.1 CDP-glycerol glycerophosphotransferase family protein [Microbacterium sp. KSW4-17]
MASFSFGAGNARKLRRIPLYVAGRLVTAVVPRSRGEWVFGCAVGLADGALALHAVAAAHGEHTTWLVADADQAREAERLGIRWVRRDSAAGFWRTARARVIVVTHGFGDVQRYATTGAVIVQLWHGIPLKRIGLDSAETTRSPVLPGVLSPVLRTLYRRATRRISLLPAASHLVRGRLESAFSLTDERVPVTGEPRVDVLSAGDAESRRRVARERLAHLLGMPLGERRVVLYAPTWRDGEPDPAVPDAGEWERIGATLDAADALLLVRSHPLGAGDYRPPRDTDRIADLGSDRVADVTPLLPGLDALITDYSSLAFDASLVPLPVVFFAPDLEAYTARRGLYGRYADVAGTDPARSWGEALTQLDAVLADPTAALAASRERSARVHAHRDGRNAERVYRAVRARLRSAPSRKDDRP